MYNFDELNDSDFLDLIDSEVKSDFDMDINTFENDDILMSLEYNEVA